VHYFVLSKDASTTLHTFEEVITTSTNREVMPISATDEHRQNPPAHAAALPSASNAISMQF